MLSSCPMVANVCYPSPLSGNVTYNLWDSQQHFQNITLCNTKSGGGMFMDFDDWLDSTMSTSSLDIEFHVRNLVQSEFV